MQVVTASKQHQGIFPHLDGKSLVKKPLQSLA